MPLIKFSISDAGLGGPAISPSSVKLQSPDGSYGVKRNDTGAVVVSSGTDMTYADGEYSYEFDDVAFNVTYSYFVRVTENSPESNVYFFSGMLCGAVSYADQPNLGGLRRRLIEESGRTDLVTGYHNGLFTDNGANRYINDAIDILDRECIQPKTDAYLFKTVPAKESIVTFSQCRYVKEVRVLPEDCEYQDFAHSRRIPWRPVDIMLAPEQIAETSSTLPEAENDVVYGAAAYPLKAIYIAPCDKERTIIIRAAWYSKRLSADTDQNVWTVQHQGLVIRVACALLEERLQNFSGMSGYYQMVRRECESIGADVLLENLGCMARNGGIEL